MLTLGELTLSHFMPHLGSTFSRWEEGALDVDLVLISAASSAQHHPDGTTQREPFSLVFTGPRDIRLTQNIHPLRHRELGALDIFLVPIGIDTAGRRYEAIFS